MGVGERDAGSSDRGAPGYGGPSGADDAKGGDDAKGAKGATSLQCARRGGLSARGPSAPGPAMCASIHSTKGDPGEAEEPKGDGDADLVQECRPLQLTLTADFLQTFPLLAGRA